MLTSRGNRNSLPIIGLHEPPLKSPGNSGCFYRMLLHQNQGGPAFRAQRAALFVVTLDERYGRRRLREAAGIEDTLHMADQRQPHRVSTRPIGSEAAFSGYLGSRNSFAPATFREIISRDCFESLHGPLFRDFNRPCTRLSKR